MIKANHDLRQLVKQKGVYMYQVADDWGIAYNTLCLKLRKPFTSKEIDRFKDSVNRISIANKSDTEG